MEENVRQMWIKLKKELEEARTEIKADKAHALSEVKKEPGL